MLVLALSVNEISEAEKVENCIEQLVRGNGKAAMEQLYLCTKDAVYTYALSLLKNTQDAEDVLHDCYISIFRSAAGYVPNGKPMAWIFVIARNLCIGKLRSRSRFSDIPEEDWEPYLESNERISPEDRIVLHHCLTGLTEDEREILLLHILSGMKHREIAELTERPLSTILSKYHRALKKMRAYLTREEETNGQSRA